MKENILIINSGSSSIKFQLIEPASEGVVLKGLAEKLGLADAHILIKYEGEEFDTKLGEKSDHTSALRALFKFLDEKDLTGTITAVGHRVVHGGETFKESVAIDEAVIAGIEAAVPLAPMHNPAHLAGIRAVATINSKLPQVAVFDTAFHSSMPPEAYRYSVPRHWYEKYGVRRYGFHGTSYKFITEKVAKLLGKKPGEVNIIVAHLGNGASITAIQGGESVATTMGFSPLSGLPMGTRSGNIDPSIIPYVMEREGLSAAEVVNELNKKSGHLGVSTKYEDMRDLEKAAEEGDEDARLAMKIFARKCAKYIAGFMTMLDQLDALVFTAGIGENGPDVRAKIVGRLGILGFRLDADINTATVGWKGSEGLISDKTSHYAIYALGTNEELMIAKDTARIVSERKKSAGGGRK
jgi:acetate kinase